MKILLGVLGFAVILGVASIATAIGAARIQRTRDSERDAVNYDESGERCPVHTGSANKCCWDCLALGPGDENGEPR